MLETTQKAGAIILSKKDKTKIALLHRGKQNDWSFPKGHIDAGENPVDAMTREIQEETGLTITIVEKLPDNVYTSPREGTVNMKMFLVQSTDDSLIRHEFEGDDIQWISHDEVIEKLSYENLKDYFKSVLHLIMKNISV